VISLGGIVSSLSVRVGGDELDAAIVDWVRREHSLAIGDRTAEEVKIAMGSAWPLDQEMIFEVGGKDLITGLPKSVEIATEDVREALAEPVSAIIDAVKQALDRTPPELAADIMERGIILSGGGALLAGLDRRMQTETGMPVYLAPEPLLSVVIGTGRALENIEAMKGLFSQPGFD
jgi:rod shape-determining protein MreB